MPGHQKDPLCHVTSNERRHLKHLSRSRSEPAAQVIGATELLAVADSVSFEGAARRAGRKSGDAVAHLVHLVARFNRDGTDALIERHGGDQPKQYTQRNQQTILQEMRR
jgi:hypothetical protein